VLMETGYAAVPEPVVETVAVAAPLLAVLADGRLKDVLDGRLKVAVAGPTGLIPFGQRADLFLAIRDCTIWIGALSGTQESTVDASRAMVRVDGLGQRLTADPDLVGLTEDRATLGHSAQLIGLGRRMLDLTVDYVTTRRQFGVPVGSFQAVKHHLANALLRLEFAAPAVLSAAWSVALGIDTRQRDVSMAAVLASEAAQAVARAAIQCHGAIGYTVEYELHRYAKRTWALAASIDIDTHIGRIAEAIL
jgi:hypothetical protein